MLITPALHKSTWELREMPYISAQYRAIVMLHRNSQLVGSRSRPLKNGAFQKNWNCNIGTFEKQPADIEHQLQPTDIAIECASEEIQRSDLLILQFSKFAAMRNSKVLDRDL